MSSAMNATYHAAIAEYRQYMNQYSQMTGRDLTPPTVATTVMNTATATAAAAAAAATAATAATAMNTSMNGSAPEWGPYVHQDGRHEQRNTSIPLFNIAWLELP
jgi:hypothetical protein